MVLSEFEAKKIEKLLGEFMGRQRPPVHIRKELDLGYRIAGQSVEIFEIRSNWRNPEEKMEIPAAKATYVKSSKVWKIYWQRADLKWHSYEPDPEVSNFDQFLALVETDKHACFFG